MTDPTDAEGSPEAFDSGADASDTSDSEAHGGSDPGDGGDAAGAATAPDTSESSSDDGSATTDGEGLVARYKWTVAKGALVTLVVAAVIALSGVALAGALSEEPADTDVEFESFDSERIVETGLPADGTIDPEPEGGTAVGTGEVVVDGSGTDRRTLGPLTEAFDSVGYDLTRNTGSIEESLEGADGLIITDPRTGYTDDEVDAIEEFVDDGGKLVILGEPNRVDVASAGLGVQLVEVESELTEVGARFGIHFDTGYVYDQQQNDGNFRHVRVEPHPDASLPGGSFADVDDAVFYTPTEVRSTGAGEPVLVTGPNARLSNGDAVGERTVALRSGNVLAIGDSRFIADDRYNVGDNDAFLASVVEFVVSDAIGGESGVTGGEETDNEEGDGEEENDGEADGEEGNDGAEDNDGTES